VHPLEVELDAVLGDVAVHPVPPNARPRPIRGIFKALAERIGSLRKDSGGGENRNCNEYETKHTSRCLHKVPFKSVGPRVSGRNEQFFTACLFQVTDALIQKYPRQPSGNISQ
jgi:hypothetical protein